MTVSNVFHRQVAHIRALTELACDVRLCDVGFLSALDRLARATGVSGGFVAYRRAADCMQAMLDQHTVDAGQPTEESARAFRHSLHVDGLSLRGAA